MFELTDRPYDQAVLLVVNTDPNSSPTVQQMQKNIKELDFVIEPPNITANNIDNFKAVFNQVDMLIMITDLGSHNSRELCSQIIDTREEKLFTIIIGIMPEEDLAMADQEAATIIQAKKFINKVDSVLLISAKNDALQNPGFNNIAEIENNALIQAILGITEIIYMPGVIRVDFADVKSALYATGITKLAFGSAQGENRARVATERALSSQALITKDLATANSILVTIRVGRNIAIKEFEIVGEMIHSFVPNECDEVVGIPVSPEMGDTLQVIIVYALS